MSKAIEVIWCMAKIVSYHAENLLADIMMYITIKTFFPAAM